jgi:hypothetical protein
VWPTNSARPGSRQRRWPNAIAARGRAVASIALVGDPATLSPIRVDGGGIGDFSSSRPLQALRAVLVEDEDSRVGVERSAG